MTSTDSKRLTAIQEQNLEVIAKRWSNTLPAKFAEFIGHKTIMFYQTISSSIKDCYIQLKDEHQKSMIEGDRPHMCPLERTQQLNRSYYQK